MGAGNRFWHHSGCRGDVHALIAALGIYALNVGFLQRVGLGGDLLRNHGNDLLAPLVLLSFANLLSQSIVQKRPFIRLSAILALVAASGLWWELVTPMYWQSTGDPRDFVSYLLGGFAYFLIQRRGDSVELR